MTRHEAVAATATTVHDHFDGSAHCVECGGPCQLTGAELLATQMVRYSFEHFALNGWKLPTMLFTGTLENHGIDWRTLWTRAKKTNRSR